MVALPKSQSNFTVLVQEKRRRLAGAGRLKNGGNGRGLVSLGMRMLFITDANGDYMVQSRYNERVCVTKLISSFTALLLYLFFCFVFLLTAEAALSRRERVV